MNDEGGTDFVQVAGPKEIAIEQIYEELLKTRKNKFYKELIQNEINKEQLEIKKKETIQSLKSKVGVVSGAEVSEYNEEQLFADLYGFSKEIREIDIIIDSCIHNIEKDKSLTDTDIDILQNHIKEFNPISKDNLIKYLQPEYSEIVQGVYDVTLSAWMLVMVQMQNFFKDASYKDKTFHKWICSKKYSIGTTECSQYEKEQDLQSGEQPTVSRFRMYTPLFETIQTQHNRSLLGGERIYKTYKYKKRINKQKNNYKKSIKKYKFKKNYM
jgi:hypothetical protein